MRTKNGIGMAVVAGALLSLVAGCASGPGGARCERRLPPVWNAPVHASGGIEGAVVAPRDGGPAEREPECDDLPEAWLELLGRS